LDTNIVIAFVLGLFLMYLIGRAMFVPLKWIIKLAVNAVVGGVVLWVINYFGAFMSLHIPLNPITALVAGFLGVPGVVLLIVVQQIIAK